MENLKLEIEEGTVYMQIPDKLTTLFQFKVTTLFRSKVTTP
jgi:hypothetical protein